ncbi:MAG: hypothetical protein K2H16_08165 [Prevotella sp.]|nr:hypothetical protein [Prevotella sp.]MDE6152307.1 hypothetical protein [Prevotella sp.]
MIDNKFNIIRYLAGMTGFVFDKDVLQRIAYDCGVAEVTDYSELAQEDKDRCKIALLRTILETPYSTASHTSKHGEWQEQIGSQSLTAAFREEIKAQLKKLAQKYDDEELLEELEGMDTNLQWMP